ncbi:GtrA family protein [Streptomyces sp. NPDC002306]
MTVNLSDGRVAALVVPALPARSVVFEVARFAVVGGSGVLVNFVVFNLLLSGLGQPATAATVLAGVLAMSANYLGFRYFAYRDRASRTRRQIALFFVLSGLGVGLESGLFYAGCHGLGLNGPLDSNIVKAVSLVLASAFRFLVYRAWVFQRDARHAA